MTKKPFIAGIVLLIVVAVAGLYLLSRRGAPAEEQLPDVIANAPSGCPQSTSLVVKSAATSTLEIKNSNANFVHWRKDQGTLYFTNYKLNPDDPGAALTLNNAQTVIKLSHMDQTDLALGKYLKTSQTTNRAPKEYASEFTISTVNGTTAVQDSNGSVDVTYLGKDYICGTVQSSDGTSSIVGQFIAKYINRLPQP